MSQSHSSVQRQQQRRGLTLLELLVVVAILAAVAGTALVAFDGLEERAASGQSAYNTNAVQRTVLQYKEIDSDKHFPTGLDSGVWTTATAANTLTPSAAVSSGNEGKFSGLDDQLQSWTRVGALNGNHRAALAAVGIDQIRFMNAAHLGSTSGGFASAGGGIYPNSAFKDPTVSSSSGNAFSYYGRGIAYNIADDGTVTHASGFGVQATNSAGALLFYDVDASGERYDADGDPENIAGAPNPAFSEATAVETTSAVSTIDGTTANVEKYDGTVTIGTGSDIPCLVYTGHPTFSNDFRAEAFGLAANKDQAQMIVLLAVGPDCSLIKNNGGDVNMIEAPYSTKAGKDKYGRFFLAFHVGTDYNGDGDCGDAGTGPFSPNEWFSEAVFLGVIDPTGEWSERELSDFDGTL